MTVLRSRAAIAAALVAFLLITWWAVTSAGLVKPLFLPKPSAVWNSAVELQVQGYQGTSLLGHLGRSMQRVLLACVVALVTAIPLGIAVGRSRAASAAVDPVVNFYRVLPPLAYYTLLVLWLGIGEASKLALLILAGFPALYIAVSRAVADLPPDREAMARTMGARGWRLYRFVILPTVLPDIMTGLRIAVGFTYTTLVAAEIVAAESGIGWMVLDASRWLRTDVMYVGIIVMGLTGVLLDRLLVMLDRRIVPWRGRIG